MSVDSRGERSQDGGSTPPGSTIQNSEEIVTPEERVALLAQQEGGLMYKWDSRCHPQCPTLKELFVLEIKAETERCAKIAENEDNGDLGGRIAERIAAKIREP